MWQFQKARQLNIFCLNGLAYWKIWLVKLNLGGQPTITVEHIHHKSSQKTSTLMTSPSSGRRRNSASPPSLRAPVTSQTVRRLSAVGYCDVVRVHLDQFNSRGRILLVRLGTNLFPAGHKVPSSFSIYSTSCLTGNKLVPSQTKTTAVGKSLSLMLTEIPSSISKGSILSNITYSTCIIACGWLVFR